MLCLTRKSEKKGQSSLEFLIMTSAVLTMFILAFLIYSNNISEGNKINEKMTAVQLCRHISSEISSATSLGGSVEHKLDIPEKLNGENYTIWIVSERKRIDVDYRKNGKTEPGASCSLYLPGVISCDGNKTFELGKNATLVSKRGGVCVEQ